MNRILRTFAVAAVSLFVGVAMAADKHEHEHQPGPDDHSVEAKVGKKYESDAPLRSYMGKIRADVQSALDQVHQGRMKDKDYQILAQKTDQSVQSIFKECKLTAEADAALHGILAKIMAGSAAMKSGTSSEARREGLLKVSDGLKSYGKTFTD